MRANRRFLLASPLIVLGLLAFACAMAAEAALMLLDRALRDKASRSRPTQLRQPMRSPPASAASAGLSRAELLDAA